MPSIDSGEKYFEGHYIWEDRKGKIQGSYNIRGILSECGFSTSYGISLSKRRVPCVLYINLWTPCLDWLGGAGKTHIDIRPYADDIAKTVSTLAYKMPSYYGQSLCTSFPGTFPCP